MTTTYKHTLTAVAAAFDALATSDRLTNPGREVIALKIAPLAENPRAYSVTSTVKTKGGIFVDTYHWSMSEGLVWENLEKEERT